MSSCIFFNEKTKYVHLRQEFVAATSCFQSSLILEVLFSENGVPRHLTKAALRNELFNSFEIAEMDEAIKHLIAIELIHCIPCPDDPECHIYSVNMDRINKKISSIGKNQQFPGESI